jgi:hypothetical protein
MGSDPASHGDMCSTLVCDTDALIQLFLSSEGELLKKLKRIYGITPVITEAVERELFRPGIRNGKHFQPQVQKALDNSALLLLDEHSLGSFTSNDPHTTYISIQTEGRKNNNHLGLGEAYSHAAGVVLRAPVMSNDMKAIITADRLGFVTAKPTVRAYDLFVLFNQIGELSEDDCNNIRKRLTAFNETPPGAFVGRKFTDGLQKFYPRLVDANHPLLANGAQAELADLHRLILHSVQARATSFASSATLGDVWPKPSK